MDAHTTRAFIAKQMAFGQQLHDETMRFHTEGVRLRRLAPLFDLIAFVAFVAGVAVAVKLLP